MRSFVTPLILDEFRLSREIIFLNQTLELERLKTLLLEQEVTALEKRLSQAKETIKSLTPDREVDLSRLSAIQFRFEI